MSCCKCCCGKKDCEEGEEGRCCCGGATGTCCQEGEYCCDGECQSEPCCDGTPITVTFAFGSDGTLRACSPQVKETQTVTIPTSVPLPFTANVSWSADDDVSINGVRLNETFNSAGGCVYGSYCCASSGSGSMTFSTRTLTVSLIDTVGVNWGGSVTITPVCPP